jgi:hypothetical protein
MSIDNPTGAHPGRTPEAWTVDRSVGLPNGDRAFVLTPVYYGPDEHGPKVGQRLVLETQEEEDKRVG